MPGRGQDPLSVVAAAREPGVARRTALVLPSGARLSYGELAARVSALAAAALEEGGGALPPVVALSASNRLETVLVLLALFELGVPVVPLHPRLTEVERRALVERSGASLWRDADLDALAERAARAGASTLGLPPRPRPDPAAPLAVVFTSGTTGSSKGARLPRRALVASATASASRIAWEPDACWLLALPLCHVGGLSVLTRSVLARTAIALLPRFEAPALFELAARAGATRLSVVPTMLASLLERPEAPALASLSFVLVGGAACPAALLEACADLGVLALTTYGMTEACSQLTLQARRPPRSLEPGSGSALPGVEIAIAGEDGELAPAGAAGRILAKGPQLFDGYLGEPGPFDARGFFDTGDFGELDPTGRLFVHARRTDLIVTGGENVYPAEVEAALEGAAGAAVGVFGVEDPRWGQLVACAVERPDDPGTEPDVAARLGAAALERLAPHKRPRLVAFLDALPRTSSGKLARSRLRDLAEPLLRPLVPPERRL